MAELADRMRVEHGARIALMVLDLSDPDAPGQMMEQADQQMCGLEVLVSNVERSIFAPIRDVSLEERAAPEPGKAALDDQVGPLMRNAR